MSRFLKRNVNEVICFSFVRSSIGRHFSKVKSRFLLLNLTSDKRSLLLKPVTNGSDGRNIHKPETKPADNPVRDLWMVEGVNKRERKANSPSRRRRWERKLTQRSLRQRYKLRL